MLKCLVDNPEQSLLENLGFFSRTPTGTEKPIIKLNNTAQRAININVT